MSEIDIEALKRLAEAATPGKWTCGVKYVSKPTGTGLYSRLFMSPTGEEQNEESQWVRDAEFVAAANPAAILDILSRLSRAEEERDQKWQPIETAPKDGTIILTWSTRLKFMLAYWGRNGELNAPSWIGGHCRVGHIDQPSHWQPLPAPPALSQGEQP